MSANLDYARDAVKKALLSNNLYKYIISAMIINGARNAKLPTKINIVAVKLTRRRFILNDALLVVDYRRCGEEGEPPAITDCTRATTAKFVKLTSGD